MAGSSSTPGKPESSQFLFRFPAQAVYSFESFIETPPSSFALSAARDLIDNPEAPFQSLFIFGRRGAGKTHLLMAMGNEASNNGQDTLYISCKEWVEKLNSAAPEQGLEWASEVSRHQLLLMDDVDTLAGAPQAQEILYQVYNTIRENGDRLVLTSQVAPGQFQETESYLTSRFQWGLTAEIGPLDEKSQASVLAKLGRDRGLELTERVLHFLVQRLPRDYPSLKNAIEKINIESLRQKKKVSLPLIKSVLDF
ncbi:MAG: ATP-binding protein [Candidatus Nitronauta litoralis]|uniref:ATP-binding protein n=1 Tax=Candidatus Nitronauta litoralis TaxID=2705533 RepID=A0A7T0BXK0_9BACT|nr:MAG: ATP-binding protein [Candidatus Nitronauta litoralis]